MRSTESNTILIALAIIIVFTILTMIIIQLSLSSRVLGIDGVAGFENSELPAGPNPAPAIRPLADTDTSATITLRSAALGITLDYPAAWRKRETTLRVVVSPSPAGLEPEQLQASALWIGIPADNTADPEILLRNLLANFSPSSASQGRMTIGAETWRSTQINFNAPSLGGESKAIMATTSKNEVGYYLVAAAPVSQWSAIEPTFQRIINSFRFTQQAVLRPTDATPPPTPTPTPTPVVYVVQPGDTLSGIAVRFGVDMEALANRNDIADPRRLRSGQSLIIPIRR